MKSGRNSGRASIHQHVGVGLCAVALTAIAGLATACGSSSEPWGSEDGRAQADDSAPTFGSLAGPGSCARPDGIRAAGLSAKKCFADRYGGRSYVLRADVLGAADVTSIDTGALAGDLAERLLPIELEPIPTHRRRPDAEITAIYEYHQPHILGALLDHLR